MQASWILTAITFLTCVISVYSSPLLTESTTSKCRSRDIAIVRRTVSDEAYFCNWWLSDVRTKSPFLEFTSTQVTNLCKCIAPAKTTTKHKRAEQTTQAATAEHWLDTRQTKASCRAEMSLQFTEPWNFCVFYNSYPRTTSPFKRYSAKDLVKLCNCVEPKAASTSTKRTSTSTKNILTKSTLTSSLPKKTSVSTSSRKAPSSSPNKATSSSATKKVSTSLAKTSSKTFPITSSESSSQYWIVLPTPFTGRSKTIVTSSKVAPTLEVSASSALTSSESASVLPSLTTTQASTIASANPLLAGYVYATNSGDRGFDNFPLQGKDNGGAIYINSTETGYYALNFAYDSATKYVHVGNQGDILCYQYYTYYADNPNKANNNSNIVSLSLNQLSSGLGQNYTPLLCAIDAVTSELQCAGKSADGRDLTKFATSDDHDRAGIRTGGGYLHIVDPAAIVPSYFSLLDLIAFGAPVADSGPNPSSSSATSESGAVPSITGLPSATESSSSVGTASSITSYSSSVTLASSSYSAAPTPTSICDTIYTDDSVSTSLEYDISCTVDYTTGSFPALVTDSLDACIEACSLDSDDGCLAAVWFQSGRDEQYCYLKTEYDLNSQATFASTDVAFSATRRDL